MITGRRVRHRKQPQWGVGVVVAAVEADGLVALTLRFDDAERKLRLRAADVDAMLETVPEREIAAPVEREAAPKAKRVAPFAEVVVRHEAIADGGDGRVAVAATDPGEEGLRLYASDGSELERVAFPRGWVANVLEGDGAGGFHAKCFMRDSELMLVPRGATVAERWVSPVKLGVFAVTPAPGLGLLVHDTEHVLLVRPGGTTVEVPIDAGDRWLDAVRAWGGELHVGLHGRTREVEPFREVVRVGLDGAVLERRPGHVPWPIADDLAIELAPARAIARDRDGRVVGELVDARGTTRDEVAPFARIEDDLVLLAAFEPALVRWHPRSSAPRWRVALAGAVVPGPAVRVGGFVVVAEAADRDVDDRRIWVVDAATGAIAHVFPVKARVRAIRAVGDDAFVAVSEDRPNPAWTRLSSGRPERLSLTHPRTVSSGVAPATGVVVTSDHRSLRFFRV